MTARHAAIAILTLAGASTPASGAPTIAIIRTRAANATGLNIFTFQIVDDEGPAVYAVEMGWAPYTASVIQHRTKGDPAAGVPLAPVDRRSVGATAAERDNDSWVFDANSPNTFGGANLFGTGDFNGSEPDDFTGHSEALWPNNYSIAVSSNGPLANRQNGAQIVASREVLYIGVITRNGVRGEPLIGNTTADFVTNVSLTAGSVSNITIAGSGTSYLPTRVASYGSPVVEGAASFDFGGVNAGEVLIALGLTLQVADLRTALGNLIDLTDVSASYLDYFNAQLGLGGSYDVVLRYVGPNPGSGPFTFSFLLDGATIDGIAVVPEPGCMGVLAVAGLPMLRRRRGDGARRHFGSLGDFVAINRLP